jgi:hypothetical protein
VINLILNKEWIYYLKTKIDYKLKAEWEYYQYSQLFKHNYRKNSIYFLDGFTSECIAFDMNLLQD